MYICLNAVLFGRLYNVLYDIYGQWILVFEDDIFNKIRDIRPLQSPYEISMLLHLQTANREEASIQYT